MVGRPWRMPISPLLALATRTALTALQMPRSDLPLPEFRPPAGRRAHLLGDEAEAGGSARGADIMTTRQTLAVERAASASAARAAVVEAPPRPQHRCREGRGARTRRRPRRPRSCICSAHVGRADRPTSTTAASLERTVKPRRPGPRDRCTRRHNSREQRVHLSAPRNSPQTRIGCLPPSC
jgi:hypothetical protein